jgi:peptidoglycan/xylan/chitin deacetylase (PgdA/CDA1 family)
VVALTFDDGPKADMTPPILDLLAERAARATFFVFGSRAAEQPALVARMLEGGHQVEPHCWSSHTSHHELDEAEIEEDIARTLTTLVEVGCPRPRLWRPPYGDIDDPLSYRVAAAHGLELVTWTLETCDWQEGRTADGILAEIDGETRDDALLELDSVVLMHDMPESPRLVGGLLDRIEARGYEAGPLSPGSAATATGGPYTFGRQDGRLPCGLEE